MGEKLNFPKPLKPGDTIAIVAPSFGATTEPYTFRFQEAVRQFKSKGYNVVIGECCHKNDGLGISTDPKTAAAELTAYYLDSRVSAVLSCGGGELMCETVSHIDFEELKKAPPKWFMGYSDNTNFIFPLVTISGIAAIYGPNAPGFGKPWEQTELDAWALLEGKTDTVYGYPMFQNPQVESEDPLSPYIFTDEKVLTVFAPSQKNNSISGAKLNQVSSSQTVEMNGILIGGCLDCLAGLSGTRFDKVKEFNEKAKAQNKKIIWVLESCDYNTMDIRRSLWHLRENGWFTNTSGFIFGRPYAAFRQEIMGVNEYNAVTGILGELNVPIVFDADIGHIDPAMPLIFGSDADVTVKGNDIKIKMGLAKND